HRSSLYPHSFPTRRSSDLTFVNHTSEPIISFDIPLQKTPPLNVSTLTFDSLNPSIAFDLKATSPFSTPSIDPLALNVTLYNPILDRKSTRLNSSHVKISYA